MSVSAPAPRHFDQLGVRLLALAALTLGECLVFQRLLFQDREEYEFVLASISGVLSGYPVSKSWQHRFLGPWLVRALDPMTGSALGSLELFTWLALLLANVLLFVLLQKRGASPTRSYFAVCCFVLAHALFSYRLEYTWDGIDALLFMSFGFWVARGGPLWALIPLLLVGTLNHETALYIPFWYVLAALPWPSASCRKFVPGLVVSPVGEMVERHGETSQAPSRTRYGRNLAARARTLLGAGATLAAMLGAIWALRERYYIGNPHLPGQAHEEQTPLISNHLHIAHNLNQLLIADWYKGRAHISATIWLAIALLTRELVNNTRHALAALWTLCAFATIVCFGYVNETRHYLLLMAFWFAYAWPPRARE
jgi:hypothetical protein